MSNFALILLCLFCHTIWDVQAWGNDGHKAVADIAYSLLTPVVKSIVDGHYVGSGKNFVDASIYPDFYKSTSQGRWSSSLHYANLPRDATQYLPKYCSSDCVVFAVANYTKLLIKEGRYGNRCGFSRGTEPCLLVWLTHLLADLHQPLHVGYGDDKGGNSVAITFFNKTGNLHSFWDSMMLQRGNINWQTLSSNLKGVIRRNPGLVEHYLSVMNGEIWANESFQIVRNNVYKFTEFQKFNDFEAGEVISEWYFNTNLPIAEERILAAGLRLAKVINDIFG